MTRLFPRSTIGAALLSFGPVAFAQSVAPQVSTPVRAGSATLSTVTVTGNPLGSDTLVAPSAVLTGDELTVRSRTTLGETLDGLPGVSSTYFGPNSSRPIIRGQDGDRIRILQNGGATIDASGLSFDHAVPVDALVTDRIEVLRGPAALLYGGSAVGGVVNLIDNRIPREPMDGVTGKVDAGVASGNRERGGAAAVEGGNARYALHADAFDRRTGDVRVPTALECEKTGRIGLARRICNSASDSKGGAVGGSLFFDRGYLGASASTYRSDYGTVAEDNVRIGMRSNRYALEGELRVDAGPLASVKARASHTDYRHTEFESDTPGTIFRNRGNDLRIEARHTPLGRLTGVVGVQAEASRFSALGEEAFAPDSRSQSTALFVYEELATDWGKLTFGGRTERAEVESFGNPLADRFEVGKRTFRPHSGGLGALVHLTPAWQLTSNLSYTQRAPKDYELFANGPHLATAAYETGDSRLGLEKSTAVDVGAAYRDGPHRFAVTAYASRFANYIGLTPTGALLNADGERNPADPAVATSPEYRYQGVRARFYGAEANATVRLFGGNGLSNAPLFGDAGSVLDLLLRGDIVRADNRDTGQPIPRIAPARVGATLAWSQGPWRVAGGFDHLAAQRRVPDGQRATGAYSLLNASLGYRTQASIGSVRSSLLWYARLDNITDRLAYSATSILTSTAFPKAPLPGRSLKLGVQATF